MTQRVKWADSTITKIGPWAYEVSVRFGVGTLPSPGAVEARFLTRRRAERKAEEMAAYLRGDTAKQPGFIFV